MDPYRYPEKKKNRKHGPYGYSTYESFRPWLRDEFEFRCVYCLRRETWVEMGGAWHIDHVKCLAENKDLKCDYDNLVYACSQCNLAKSDMEIDDPCKTLSHCSIQVSATGEIHGTTKNAKRIIKVLGLDSPESTEFRLKMIKLYEVLKSKHELFISWFGYPRDLPDLSKLNCKNSRPAGIGKSAYELSKARSLPDTY